MRSIKQILKDSKTVAIVGLSSDPARPSLAVAEYLKDHGYRIIPVNPSEASVLGEQAYPSLRDIPTPVDLVVVFRRSEAVVPIAREAVDTGAKALWMQLGIINQEAADLAAASGLDVVMDQCAKRQHTRLSAEGKL